MREVPLVLLVQVGPLDLEDKMASEDPQGLLDTLVMLGSREKKETKGSQDLLVLRDLKDHPVQ